MVTLTDTWTNGADCGLQSPVGEGDAIVHCHDARLMASPLQSPRQQESKR